MELRIINQRIKHIAKAAASLNTYIHETAVGIIQHALDTGDCTAALRLVQAMPKSQRRGLVVTWFGRYSPIGMNVSTGKVGLHREGAKSYNPFNVDAARLNPFYDMPEAQKEDLPVTLEDVRNNIFSLATRLQKKMDNGEIPEADKVVVTSTVTALKALGAAVPLAAPAKQAA